MRSTDFLFAPLLLLVVLLLANNSASAFKGNVPVTRSRPAQIGPSSTRLYAAKKAKKAAKKAASKKAPVETFKKSEFISSVAEKTGMSKVDSEAALTAVLDTITEVSGYEADMVSPAE